MKLSSLHSHSFSSVTTIVHRLKAPLTRSILAGGTLLLMSVAHADTYHAVENGETLNAISARYQVRAELIRAANGLGQISDNATLPSMLLRIPDSNAKTSDFRNLNAAPAAAPATAPATGSISTAARYTVAAGDTLESIAATYARRGYKVTAEDIRLKNDLNGQPTTGKTLTIPLGGLSYSEALYRTASSKQVPPTATSAATSVPGVQVSEEVAWPEAKVLSSKTPVYQAPGTQKATRGPSALASRGYFPSPNLEGGSRDGVRVLGPDEEARNSASNSRTPSPRVLTAPAPKKKLNLARVAQVAQNGARIRRLPTAEAVTLYSCPVKTELAVTKQNGAWSAILMSDRSTGWVPTRYLRFTGASVDITSQVVTNNTPTKSYNGKFNSNNPMVAQALTWLGTPYVYGGESRRGIDCSALVQNSFRACGVRLPRTAAEQSKVGTPIDPSHLQAGDRLYFSASGSRVDHTGLYMGNGLFVHASGSGRRVMVSNLFERRNWNIFVGARR